MSMKVTSEEVLAILEAGRYKSRIKKCASDSRTSLPSRILDFTGRPTLHRHPPERQRTNAEKWENN